MSPTLFIGLMSGTSLDGVDAVLADFGAARPRLVLHRHAEFAPDLRRELELLMTAGWDDLHRASVAAQHLARSYAAVCGDLLRNAEVDAALVGAIGVHGQTIRHRPEEGYTCQLNAPAVLAEMTGIDVVADFRARDVAAGGQGAPLVPAFHEAMFRSVQARAVVNIGGISNITGIPAFDSTAPIVGLDCGPGNLLIDAWAHEHLNAPMDRDGHWAAGGHTDAGLLQAMLAEPYFAAPPPKSTGRELFNVNWVRSRIANRALDARDVQATLTRLTATVIASSIEQHFPAARDVLVCGGGARNPTLMRMLAEECAPRSVASTATLDVAPEHVEALAFAWLAQRFVQRLPGNAAAVTGARGPRVLGALYPA